MIDDTRAAIDAFEKDANVDPERISRFGYTRGDAPEFRRVSAGNPFLIV